MKESDFEDMFEKMKKPDVNVNPPKEIKLAILNYRKSALLTVGFVVLPAIFIFGMVMKYEFDVDLGIVLVVAEWIASFDRIAGLKWLGPFVLVGLPLVGIVLNALAITHVSYLAAARSIQVTVKLRWLNLSILVASLGVVGIIFLYIVAENCR